MKKYFEKYKSIMGLLFLLILPAIFVFLFLEERRVTAVDQSLSVESEREAATLFVEISGQVASPGVYEVQDGTILLELVEKAGGFLEKADKYFIAKNINLAKKLFAEEKIYIPQSGEMGAVSSGGSTEVGGKVNINTASVDQLDSLPGIGPSTAEKIIQARPFKSIDDLQDVSGIGESKFEDIKDKVTI